MLLETFEFRQGHGDLSHLVGMSLMANNGLSDGSASRSWWCHTSLGILRDAALPTGLGKRIAGEGGRATQVDPCKNNRLLGENCVLNRKFVHVQSSKVL